MKNGVKCSYSEVLYNTATLKNKLHLNNCNQLYTKYLAKK